MYKNYREVSKLLRQHGCEQVRKSKHRVWYSPMTRKNFTVPHIGVKDRKLFLQILKQAGIK